MKQLIIGMAMGFFVVSGRAEQDPACNSPQIQSDARTVQRMLAIAATCELPAVARLYYNRAYLLELMTEFHQLNNALTPDKTTQAAFEAYRLFIGLAEAFAGRAISRGDMSALGQLNETYRQYIEITEMRLKGYDLLADRMERELRL